MDTNLQDLRSQLPFFCLSSRADSTRRNYQYSFNAFCKWCFSHNITKTLPTTEFYVSLYLVHLANLGKSTSTLNESVYAISWAHRLAGLENPCKSDLVISVKEGAHRVKGHFVQKKEPITPDMLKKICVLYGNDNSNLKDLRLACMCVLGFAGFLRYSEIANLKMNNITFCSDHVKLFLEVSKTDIYREGREVVISKTGNITCPVEMLRKYIMLANIQIDSSEHMFRPLSFCKSTNTYKLRKGPLSYTTAREILLKALKDLGLDTKHFGLHSLRSGGATAAASAQIEDRLFKKHGRWKTDKAKDGYVKENITQRLLVTKNLGI